ncbi:hypothetical protein A2833_00285 [Candidatus Azambacteria bacterium RIFCSPHIGHO2_01_FULL_44_55]|uniref:Uncharacterized protein n=1 Tax=Candidatus Azambacteria bacterium RIFCSPLOWO2_02_FULL_44_14 TaxID=1797306 RepID=A0A1F5CBI5_9BACT|nr:MAG: hypothetical protein A3A18_00630 [Candidatus Azambacteria bacterium RIFCSPLOWO2_01_FULL_44_84]OGD32842.1 MAG: hypothetical protein A3C78_03535 [Candidatus Azambacteria bacterium RIFCSPHIGHO2_02_FULL_45_18]OGD40219.1 MAG: hypothetical protein A3I30_03055 [Candidatus Azambacteria bacterium RIFCSPLOWO2_02_FULL_44_14]OGD41612.1 MAG: hypothetical protein A2833_00285 [Candidatus Azambacteria bacterium RIFCSPHIGHO2_01_FULL_44_55]OGD51185.1 MAG: hypothetical protein A2608_01755 [Candidatus Azam
MAKAKLFRLRELLSGNWVDVALIKKLPWRTFLQATFVKGLVIRRKRRASKSDPSRPARRATKRVSEGQALWC